MKPRSPGVNSGKCGVMSPELPKPVADRVVVLCDDVLYTGRTVRAALDEKVITVDPVADRLKNLIGSARIHIMRGKTAYNARDYDSALREFQAAHEADPQNVTAMIDLATTLVAKGNQVKATELLKQAVTLEPDRANAHDSRLDSHHLPVAEETRHR